MPTPIVATYNESNIGNITNTTNPLPGYYTDDYYAYLESFFEFFRNSYGGNYPDEEFPLLCFCMVWGIVLIVHSWYLHRWKWSKVRVFNDMAAICMSFHAMLFAVCIKTQCSYVNTVIVYNILATVIFSSGGQLADNYLTFLRFDVIMGGTSTQFKVCVFVYAFVFMYFSWYSYFIVFPFFANQYDPFWLNINIISSNYVYMWSYFVFNAFFLIPLVYKLFLIRRVKCETIIDENRKRILTDLTVRASLHTLASIIALAVAVHHIPWGAFIQNIILTTTIHVFLNWKIKYFKLMPLNYGSENEKSKVLTGRINWLQETELPFFGKHHDRIACYEQLNEELNEDQDVV